MKRSAIKRKPRKRPPIAERWHLDRVAAMPCLVCGATAEVHHVHSDGYQRLTRTHRRVTPLCPYHHRTGPLAVHVLGHSRFASDHGIDLLAVADALWLESEELERG